MKTCAYCNKVDDRITKEHVVNKTFIDKYYKIGKGYANAYEKYTENYLTAKDVCTKCNNENLSVLDEYFLDFYSKNIPEQVIDSGSTIILKYDFENLTKWILKTLYNSERKNAYKHLPLKMHRYRDYILGKDKRSKLFRIYIELLQDIPKDEILKHGHISEEEVPDKINYLKVGNSVFSDQRDSNIINTFKYIISSNFMFHVFILDPRNHSHEAGNKLFNKYCLYLKTNKLYPIAQNKKEVKVIASQRTILDILDKTYEGDKHITERMREIQLITSAKKF